MLLTKDPILTHTTARNQIGNNPGYRMLQSEIDQQRRLQEGEHPAGDDRLIIRRPPTGAYNCHALTFISRRSWLGEEEAVNLVLRDDGYVSVEAQQAKPGDVILYYYSDGALEHSGIVVSNPQNDVSPRPWILSKWAKGGEFIHRYDYCPYNWQNVRYMREGQND